MVTAAPDDGAAPAAPSALALAQLADDVARALSSYAAALRRGGVHAPPPAAPADADTPPAAALRPVALGERQQRLLALPDLDSAEGLSNREIAERLGIKTPNATALTKRLAELGHLIAVPDESPVRYRRAVPTAPAKPPRAAARPKKRQPGS